MIVLLGTLVILPARGDVTSGDASLATRGESWTMATAAVERTVKLDRGRLRLSSFRNLRSGREMIAAGAVVDELPPEIVGVPGDGPWVLRGSKESRLGQGELQLEVTLARGPIEATKAYVVYPSTGLIREWLTLRNAGNEPIKVVEPGFLAVAARVGDASAVDLHWMTGGENQPGSWALKTESLSSSRPRRFDSYEPLSIPSAPLPGDGVDARIMHNGRQVWPASGWQYIASAAVTVPFDLTADVKAGDTLSFEVGRHGNIGWDTTALDPTIRYEDGEAHVASREFGGEQGGHGWRYGYLERGRLVDLVYYPGPNQWRKEKDNATGTPFVGPGNQHPDFGQDSARVWTAARTGKVRISGSVCNTGNTNGANNAYGFRMGSSSYAPWFALRDRTSGDGLVIGLDYFGHWTSEFRPAKEGTVAARLNVAGHRQTLAPGASLTTPKAFTAIFTGDLDDAGNEVLDWQYRYLWDYTRDGWFPATRMLGYWYKGTTWGQANSSWVGGRPDYASSVRKIFRTADLMRYTGASVYHRDWGWWDRAGDWNGPDFRATGDYLRKAGMGQLIYAFLYTVDPESKVAREHPDWVLGGGTLDMSRPEVVAFMLGQLDDFAARWGDFEWRNDSTPTAPKDGDDTPLLAQDAGLRRVLATFLDRHPKCAFQAVNGGGNDVGYDYARYASNIQFSDGVIGLLRNQWATLLLPPDKTCDNPDQWNPDAYNKATWRGLLTMNFDMTGDTWDPAKLEGVRELIDVYRYLLSRGVVGRWVRVHRPAVTGDDPTMYFERLSGDRKRGIIIPKRPAPGPVTIHPRGLIADETYAVTFHEAPGRVDRKGADLMARGIVLESMIPGELIYLNLPLHPGSTLDATAPSAPSGVRIARGENLGYPGVEITWSPGKDDNWLSYYEVLRDGTVIGKVAQGTYEFDHSAGADLGARYEVRTVDGGGNRSSAVAATGRSSIAAHVLDDADRGVTLAGTWKRESGLQPAHAGTIAASNRKGATAEATIEGRRLLVFSKLGADCGRATVSVDGGPAEAVDTYSADDVWGVCVFRKEFAASGKHSVKITVAGDHSDRSGGAWVHLDGLRAEQD
ncbi:hypothetical protein [Aquisphaera insulae]|uniref:hypothetical protein n=1 Tax=Aquisphaera insulae TaxID=2712864 RepID=UPI0013ECBA25|nr:hypothetical protein [Aquisphaera insulae]